MPFAITTESSVCSTIFITYGYMDSWALLYCFACFYSFRQKSLWIRTDQLFNANEGIVENVGKCGQYLTTVNHDKAQTLRIIQGPYLHYTTVICSTITQNSHILISCTYPIVCYIAFLSYVQTTFIIIFNLVLFTFAANEIIWAIDWLDRIQLSPNVITFVNQAIKLERL